VKSILLRLQLLLLAGLLGACSGQAILPAVEPALSIPTDTPLPSATLTETVLPTATETPSPTPSETPTSTATLTPSLTPIPAVRISAVGDILLGRTVGDKILSQGPQVVFDGVLSALLPADILVGNLECALTTRGTAEPKSYRFRAPLEGAMSLSMAGFDVLTLANNHAMDYGVVGLQDSLQTLSQYGIQTVGAGNDAAAARAPVILERNGMRVAFLGYVDVPVENSGFDTRTWIASANTPGVAWAYPEQIAADVSAARQQADVVVVLLHSGYELNETIANNQRLQAHTAIDAGATLVIGAHSHLLQRVEYYKNGLIAYSLGNFVFDDYEGIVNATVIFNAVLTPAGLQSWDYTPVLIEDGLPQLTEDWVPPAIGTLIAPFGP
jgi:poly-gamma-glutamate synthesis protein (capsule biosynthesis protein)